MGKKLIFLACVFALQTNTVSFAEDSFMFIETFGSPEQTLVDYSNPDNGVMPQQIVDNPKPIIALDMHNRAAVPYGALPTSGQPGWNPGGCSDETHGRYGILRSNILVPESPIVSKDVTGDGFYAYYYRKNLTGQTFLAINLPGERLVAGNTYTLSGWAANGYGSSWEACGENPTFKLRIASLTNVTSVSADGKTQTGGSGYKTDNPSTEFDSNVWKKFEQTSNNAEEGKILRFELRGIQTKASIVLIDSLIIHGKRPEISGVFTPISLTADDENEFGMSGSRTVSCDHAGDTPITLTLSGDNASNFVLCDESGSPLSQNTFDKSGGSFKVKFTPSIDSEEGKTYTATLTINSATNPSFGAANQIIELTGTDNKISSIKSIDSRNPFKLTLSPNPVKDLLVIVSDIESLVDVSIIDLTGKTLISYSNYSLNTPIDVSRLSAGCYVVCVNTEEGKVFSINSRFVKY